MKELIESVAFEGTRLHGRRAFQLPGGAAPHALATDIRMFERYPVMDRVAVVSEAGEVLTCPEIQRPVHPGACQGHAGFSLA